MATPHKPPFNLFEDLTLCLADSFVNLQYAEFWGSSNSIASQPSFPKMCVFASKAVKRYCSLPVTSAKYSTRFCNVYYFSDPNPGNPC